MTTHEDFDPVSVQREAAMFYGLFLRGQSAEKIRQDIDIPQTTLDRWLKRPHYDGSFRDNARRVYEYRKQVLAVFEELVFQGRVRARVQ